MHDLLGREQLRPVTDVVHGTVIIYDLVFLNSICYSSKKISLSVPFLTLKDATNSKTNGTSRSSKDGTFTCSAC